MLDLSGLLAAWSVPMLVGIVVTITSQIDRFNDRAIRPIPVAKGSIVSLFLGYKKKDCCWQYFSVTFGYHPLTP